MNYGGIRSSWNDTIYLENLFEIMPFENELTLVEISYDSLISMANFICSEQGSPIYGMSINCIHNNLSVMEGNIYRWNLLHYGK